MYHQLAPMLCIVCTICVLLRVTTASQQELIVNIVCDADNQNDVVWRLEKVDENNVVVEVVDIGRGDENTLQTRAQLSVDDTDCLRFNLTDVWGDGFNGDWDSGRVDVYFGEPSISEQQPTETIYATAYSDRYLESGRGGSVGTAIHYIQNGVEPLGGCAFAGVEKPATGCHEEAAVDVVFMLDTATELLFDCQNFYFAHIVNLVEHHLPRENLRISVVTFGTDETQRAQGVYAPIVAAPLTDAFALTPALSFGANGTWQQYKTQLRELRSTACIGGGHATIDALNQTIQLFVNANGETINTQRQQYALLFTNRWLDVEQTKNRFSCSYTRSILQVNSIALILVSEAAANANLTCLLEGQPQDSLVQVDYLSKLSDYYDEIEELACSERHRVVLTEVFIDDSRRRWWMELINLGAAVNVADLVFAGNLFAGSVDDDAATIEQGEVFVIGNMGDATYTPCATYFGISVNAYDCTNYFAVQYLGDATLNAFSVALANNEVSGVTVSPQAENAPFVDAGYSYQLRVVSTNWSDLSNWAESCYPYGNPGLLPVVECEDVCDPRKCTAYGDTAECDRGALGAVCVDVSSPLTPFVGAYEYCVNTQCACNLHYYFDADATRSCRPLLGVPSCLAYVVGDEQGLIEMTWTESPHAMITDYKVLFSTGELELTSQGQTIEDPAYSVYTPRIVGTGIDPSDGHTVESEATECVPDFAPTRRPTFPDETWSPTASPTAAPVTTPIPSFSPTKSPTFAGCGSSLQLDLMFVLDSSTSVLDTEYANWQAELDFAKAIVNSSLPGDSKVGCINFSGCSLNRDFEQCKAKGKLKKMWGLTDFGTPNDQQAVYDRFAAMGPSDFNTGYTWTVEAMYMSLQEFYANSTADRKRMMIIVTDGVPYPPNEDGSPLHEPCMASTGYESSTLRQLRQLGVRIITVGIQVTPEAIAEFFSCVVDDFDKHFFYATDFDALNGLVKDIGKLVCNADISLIINEVALKNDYGANGEPLFFIELYNPSIGVSLNGFRFKGMMEYNLTADYAVSQGQYWVISTYDMNSIDQNECRNCSQDLLVDAQHADTRMNDTFWWLEVYNAAGELLDAVVRNPLTFPIVDDCYTHELQYEDLDNSLGGNWEESCFVYGTPQDPNQEPCPCLLSKCIQAGDTFAYCDQAFDALGNSVVQCQCSSRYILSGGNCIPAFEPEACFAFEEDCAAGTVLLAWRPPASSAVISYRIYKDNATFLTVSSTITEITIYVNASLSVDGDDPRIMSEESADCGAHCLVVQTREHSCGPPFFPSQVATNYSVSTIFQSAPLIESAKQYCKLTPPTLAPTQSPTNVPTSATSPPTSSPTSVAPTTAEPTRAPTPFCCDYLMLHLSDNATLLAAYDDAVVDLQTVFILATDSVALDHWRWSADRVQAAEIFYDDSTYHAWTVYSADAFLILPAANANNTVPPYVQSFPSADYSEWIDLRNDQSIELLLLCSCDQPTVTSPPTPSPLPTPPPTPNDPLQCTVLTVSSSVEPLSRAAFSDQVFVLDEPPIQDGRGKWVANVSGSEFLISYYSAIDRWTLHDLENDEIYLAPLELSAFAEPMSAATSSTALTWAYASSSIIRYELTIECVHYPTAPPTTVPVDLSECTFPDYVVNSWDAAYLQDWTRCYFTTYSDGTTLQELQGQCVEQANVSLNGTLDDVYVFVGAIDASNLNLFSVGAYGHMSVLQTTTSSLTRAEQTSIAYPAATFWYNVPGVAFGFSSAERIDLTQNGGSCDVHDLQSDDRLCWHLINEQIGGWRAGAQASLNLERNVYKAVYWKRCNQTFVPEICDQISVLSNDYAVQYVRDYGITNDGKASWQSDVPPNDAFEIGWLSAENAWLFDAVSVDGAVWLHEPLTETSIPPFDTLSTWYNEEDRNQSIELYLSCNVSAPVVTPSPTPPDSNCSCVELIANGLSAVEGHYVYVPRPINQNYGGEYLSVDDDKRLYFDSNKEAWILHGNGAYFELTPPIVVGVGNTQLPPLNTLLTFIDRDLSTPAQDVTVQIEVRCQTNASQCVAASSSCPEYNVWEYVETEFEYTSSIQFGFPRSPTQNTQPLLTATSEFLREYDGLRYILNDRESVLQVAISDYVLDGSVTLTKQRLPPVTISAVYDSLDENVYRDSNSVGIWFQLLDAHESTYLDLSDSAVTLIASCTTCDVSDFTQPCDVSAVSNKTGFNALHKCELTILESLFVANDTNQLQVWAELYTQSTGALVTASDVIELTLAPRIEAEGILFPGIYGEFAMSPRYMTDEVRLTLWLNSDDWSTNSKLYQKRYAQAWWLSIAFNADVLSYVEFVPDDIWGSIQSLYASDESNGLGEIEIWGSKIGQLLNTHGRNVSVGFFKFVVNSGIESGLYDNVLSFLTLSMSGDNGYAIANDVEGYMADRDGWYTTQASLMVIPDEPLDIFVEVDSINLWNTAFLSGVSVSRSFPFCVVYHFAIRLPEATHCSRDTAQYGLTFFVSNNGLGCLARTTVYHSQSGVVFLDITADDSITKSQKIQVWLPIQSSFRVVPFNTGTKQAQFGLKQVDMAYRAVGDIYYESLPLYVYCQFECSNCTTQVSASVSVNEFITDAQQFNISDEGVAQLVHYSMSNSRFLLQGLSQGTASVTLQLDVAGVRRIFDTIVIGVGVEADNSSTDLPFASIVGFGGVLVTHAAFESDTMAIVDVDLPLAIKADLVSELSNVGDIGSIHAFMLLDDDLLIDLTDEVNIVYTSVIPQELSVQPVNKNDGNNMELPGAFVTLTSNAQQRAWTTVVEYEWLAPNMSGRVRGRGCIPAAINLTQPLNISVSLSCDTNIITRIGDPADYIFGIPVECYLVVLVHWEDGTVTDMSRDARTNYHVITPHQLLTLYDQNIVRANRSCDIHTQHGVQNPDCSGSDIVNVNFTNYTALETWSGTVEIQVVIFDRLTLKTMPAPFYDNTSYEDPTLLNQFYCSVEYQRAQFEVFGNLTDGQWRELTDRIDVQLDLFNATPPGSAEVDNALRQIDGLATGSSQVQATLAGFEIDPAYRDNYYSNLEDFSVSDEVVTMTDINMYTFADRAQVFEDLIDTRELLTIDVAFSDGVIIKDVLRAMLMNGLWSDIAVSDVFSFSSTDPNVVAVSDDGYVTILDNWWREVNISVSAQCGPDAVAAQELIYPNLKPDFWDVDVEAPYTSTGLQFSNKDSGGVDESGEFLWNVYINATNGTLLSFSIRLYYDDTLFIENGTRDCSYFWNTWNGGNNSVDSWPQCYAAGDWEGQMLSWNLDTVRGELRLAGASSQGSSTNSSLQHVATCNFRVNTATEENISMVAGQVIEITYIDHNDETVKHVYDQPIVAGDGYQQVNQGTSIKPEFPANVQQRYINESTHRNYACAADTNDEYIFASNTAAFSGCCDSGLQLFGDANYDCRHTAWDAQAATLYFIDTTSVAPFFTLPLSNLSHSQRIAMDQSLDYLQDDRNECADASLSNPCPNGLEDIWYSLQVSTGKFLYLNVSAREETLEQDGRVVRGVAPMFIQEYSNYFRLATDKDATVYFELKNVSVANRNGFIGTDALSIGTYLPSDSVVYNNYNNDDNFASFRIENTSILIQGEYVDGKYWTFETNEYNWTDADCIEMAILYQTYDEDGNCSQIDREYAFRGSRYYGDSFLEFTTLCLKRITNPPTIAPTNPPTSAPTAPCELCPEIVDCRYEDHGTAILMYFSQDTDRAGFEGTPFSCLSIFTPPSFQTLEGMTFDSRCIWKDFRTIRIELGYNVTVRPTHEEQSYHLELVGNNIRDYAQASAPTKGYCIVYPMFNPPPVWTNIIGSTQLAPCDDLRLSGTPTKGQAPPMRWKWTLTQSQQIEQNGCSFKMSGTSDADNATHIALDQETLSIPNQCLTGITELFVVLNATNHYYWNFSYPASTHLLNVIVRRQMSTQQQAIPSVQLLTPLVINITSEQDLIVPLFVSAFADSMCGSTQKVYDLSRFSFQWTSLSYTEAEDPSKYPFGSFFDDIRPSYLQVLDSSAIMADTSPTLIVPGFNFEAGNYYAFGVEVTFDASTNYAFVGVIVNLPIPYPRASTKYVSLLEDSDIALDIFDFYEFFGFGTDDDVSAFYGIEWNCFYANSNLSVLYNASLFADQSQIVLNQANAALEAGDLYNCSAHLFSKERSTMGMTWGRQESYFVFEYVGIAADNSTDTKSISVFLSDNVGTVNRNKRIVISATFVDLVTGVDSKADGQAFDDYLFEWSNFGENSNVNDAVYGISVIEHIDYERNYTVNFVVDDEVNRFVYDGQKLGFQLKVTNQNEDYSGYGQLELIANRGPNGGNCVVQRMDDTAGLYRVECVGWTDEYMELTLQYNWMLLTECYSDTDCARELVCDTEQSEYDVGVCVVSTLRNPIQNYLREWTAGNIHYFSVRCDTDETYVLRSYIRDYSGFLTTFDTVFEATASLQDGSTTAVVANTLEQIASAKEHLNTNAFSSLIATFDAVSDCLGDVQVAERTPLVPQIKSLYDALVSNSVNTLYDKFYDFNKIYSTILDAVYFDHDLFAEASLLGIADTYNIANLTFAMIEDMLAYFNEKRDGLYDKMIPRDLAVYELAAMTWSGDSAFQDRSLRSQLNLFNVLKDLYFGHVLEVNRLGLNGRLIDETHFNVSYGGLQVLSGWETKAKLFSDESDCGGDLIDIAPDFEFAYFGDNQVDYVKCELVAFNGGMLSPRQIAAFLSSPIIYWNLRGFTKDGVEVPIGGSGRGQQSRRRLIEFDDCAPFLYTVPHNDNTTLRSYQTRRQDAEFSSSIAWAECKQILNLGEADLSARLESEKIEDIQAPDAADCYVLTHDEDKTVCACNSNYTLLAIKEEIYFPRFLASLHRFNPPFTWTGLMESVGAVMWLFVLLFLFTFAFYILPSLDKHKALLAVKKGLPKSQREGAFFQTAEGKVYRAARINMNHLSFCQIYVAVYKVRLRNDHMCLWTCCDDPGSNISHFSKVSLAFMYCLLFMWQIAWFYGGERETLYPGTLFAFLVAFETILPIWLCGWCISKIRPHEFTDEEIDELVEHQMPLITKNQEWRADYESDGEHADEEAEQEEGDGFFAPPAILENAFPEKQSTFDIKRVFTDIDEEVEYLEENYMPVESTWLRKKRKPYNLFKVGYAPLEETNHEHSDSVSSLDSREERRGFEGVEYASHWYQARDAVTLGFVPVDENEEYDAAASKMLRKNREENLAHNRKKKEKKSKRRKRENSVSSKISSLFRGGDRENSISRLSINANDDSKAFKKKKKKDKKRRRSSRLTQWLGGSSPRGNDDELSVDVSVDSQHKKVARLGSDDDMYADYGDEASHDSGEEVSIEFRKKRKDTLRVPTTPSMHAPKPMHNGLNGEIELETQHKTAAAKKAVIPQAQRRAAQTVAVHLSAPRKYQQFQKILKIGRMNASKIESDADLLSRIVDNALLAGDNSMFDCSPMAKRAATLIRGGHALFDKIESGATSANQKQIQQLLRRQDVINTVFVNLDDPERDAHDVSGMQTFAYSPEALRQLEQLPERAPSQRPYIEKKTKLDDDLWQNSDVLYGQNEVQLNDGTTRNDRALPNKPVNVVNMDDIWEVTGALPPELLSTLEDPFNAWQKEQFKPVQQPLRDDEEDEYRNVLSRHFKRRRELLHRKYWLPRWCRYVLWIILFLLIAVLIGLFLYEGNKLGANFLWVPEPWNNSNCTLSIAEQTRFDYDYSLDEAERRNPACSPQEILGSMPHCWDYRVRFTIASFITFLTSVLIVQPLYIAILTLIAITLMPICSPLCISCRNRLFGLSRNDPGYKQFLGGTITTGDVNLEYGPLADAELTQLSELSHAESEKSQNSNHDLGTGDKSKPLLTTVDNKHDSDNEAREDPPFKG